MILNVKLQQSNSNIERAACQSTKNRRGALPSAVRVIHRLSFAFAESPVATLTDAHRMLSIEKRQLRLAVGVM